jgi:hypothetical protein
MPTAKPLAKPRSYPQVVLIGPTCAGKSTISELLAERLNLPLVSLDEIAEHYYAEIGMTREVTEALIQEQGFAALYTQLAPAMAHATMRLIEDHETGIMDLGAGHSHFTDAILFEQVRAALAPCPNVVLLLPCPDLERAVAIVRARNLAERGWDWKLNGYDYLEHWVKGACNHRLATLTMYTENNTPVETCEALMMQLVR